MLEYKGYKISSSSTPMYMEGCESLGSVCKPGRNGSVIEIARIEGKIFKTMKEAEAHGLELAREWVDNLRNSLFLLSCGSSGGFLLRRHSFHAAF
jgi:hypothetical protein